MCIHMTVLLMRCCMVRSNCAGEESEQIRPVSSAYKLTSGTTEGRSGGGEVKKGEGEHPPNENKLKHRSELIEC